jgi:hypothetical protein
MQDASPVCHDWLSPNDAVEKICLATPQSDAGLAASKDSGWARLLDLLRDQKVRAVVLMDDCHFVVPASVWSAETGMTQLKSSRIQFIARYANSALDLRFVEGPAAISRTDLRAQLPNAT